MQRKISFFFFLTHLSLLSFLGGCYEGKFLSLQLEETKGTKSEELSSDPNHGTIKAKVVPPSHPYSEESEDMENLKAYVEGFPQIQGRVSPSGEININKVPLGERNIIIVQSIGELATLPATLPQSLQVKRMLGGKSLKFRVAAHTITDFGQIPLKETGILSGQVKINRGKMAMEGINIYLEGTSFLGQTNVYGQFTLEGIPEGDYNVVVEKEGFKREFLKVKIISGQYNFCPDINLNINLGPEGVMSLNHDAPISPRLQVPVTFSTSQDVQLVAISEDPHFINAKWLPPAEVTEYFFSSPGRKRLYVKFASTGGLVTFPSFADVIVDTEGPKVTLTINQGQLFCQRAEVTLSIEGHDDSPVKDMMISESSTFQGAVWEPFQVQKALDLSAGDGLKTLYLKLRDQWNHEGDVATQQIHLDTQAPVRPQIDIQEGDFTSGLSINLNLSVETQGGPLSEVQITEDPFFRIFKTLTLINSSLRYPYTLSGEGKKVIYARFVDKAGNFTEVVSDSIIVDRTPPTAPRTGNTGRRVTLEKEEVRILEESMDKNFQVYQIKGGAFFDWTELPHNRLLDLEEDETWYHFQLRAMDMAGNVSDAVSWSLFRGEKTFIDSAQLITGSALQYLALDGTVVFSRKFSPYLLGPAGTSFYFSMPVKVEAGVNFRMTESSQLYFAGLTQIDGTAEAPVLVTSDLSFPLPGDWKQFSLYFNQANPGYAKYLRVEFNESSVFSGGNGSNISKNEEFILSDSEFSDFSSNGLMIYGGNIKLDHVSIKGSSTHPDNKIGIYAWSSSNSELSIFDSQISHCHQGIYLTGGYSLNLRHSNLIGNAYANLTIAPQAFPGSVHKVAYNFWDFTQEHKKIKDDNEHSNHNDHDDRFKYLKISTYDQNGPAVYWDPFLTEKVKDVGPRI